jgi:dihydropyrimidinase
VTEARPFDLVIRGGRVVLPDATRELDIGIHNGVIAALGPDLARGVEELSARDRLVLPGGVDSHCHMDQQPWEGRSTADDFNTGTLSALCGGTTTVIPFAMQMRGQSLAAIVADYHERAGPKAHIDYGFPPDRRRPHRKGAAQRDPGADRAGLHLHQDLSHL